MKAKYPPTESIKHHCPECGGTMEDKTITHEQYDPAGVFVVVHNVPASVCKQCGAIYMEGTVLKQLEDLIKNTEPLEKIKTPTSIFDFAQSKG